jgi:hypothetical protein
MRFIFLVSVLWSSVAGAQQRDPAHPFIPIPTECRISQNFEYEVIYFGAGRLDNYFFPSSWSDAGLVVKSNLQPFCLCKSNSVGSEGFYCSDSYEPSEGAAIVAGFQQRRNEEQAAYERIFDNCLIDRMSENPASSVVRAVRRRCEEIALQPSFFDKLKYD